MNNFLLENSKFNNFHPKSLLTILTSPHLEIHEQTLLLPIKTCYNIQISSRSLINQASARAALTQIINTVLTRLENSVGIYCLKKIKFI